MRILEINKFYFAKGGADKHFLDVCKLLEKGGHKVAVFSMQHEKNLPSIWEKFFLSKVGYTYEYSFLEKIKGVGRMFFSLEARKKINEMLDEFKPEIVHVHNIYHQLSPTILFEIKKRNIPILMTVHDYKLVNPNHSLFLNGKFYDRCKDGKFYQCFFDKAVKDSYCMSFLATLEMYWHEALGTYRKNIDAYVAPSEFVKKILIERGIPAEKIFVLPHFAERTETNTSVLQNTVIEDGKYAKEKYALYFGRISKQKGVDELLEIFSQNKNLKLHLAGVCENNFEIPSLLNIKHLGFLNQAQLAKEIANARLVVSPSRLPETFGLIALEAILHGKPFVGFETGAYGEIIKNNENGFLVKNNFELEEKIQKMMEKDEILDQKKIQKMARKAFNSQKYLQNLEKIIYSIQKKA